MGHSHVGQVSRVTKGWGGGPGVTVLTALVIVRVGRCAPARMGVLAALVIVLIGCLGVVVAALVSTTTSVMNNLLSLLPRYLHNKQHLS